MDNDLWLRKYFEEKLILRGDLQKYLEASSVVSVELDHEIAFDLMVLVPDLMFEGEFKVLFGEYFVVNDQEQSPHVFTRFKSYRWLRKDLSSRLPIALWIFGKSAIIQDPTKDFGMIIREYAALFSENREDIIRRKYIEFRSDRHNLRQAVYHQDMLAVDLLRANVIKIALEILILSHGKPYPYKKWLPSEAKKLKKGQDIVFICEVFVKETNLKKVISLSDELVDKIVKILADNSSLSSGLLNQWWLHLA